jgi:hypothetical protein
MDTNKHAISDRDCYAIQDTDANPRRGNADPDA